MFLSLITFRFPMEFGLVTSFAWSIIFKGFACQQHFGSHCVKLLWLSLHPYTREYSTGNFQEANFQKKKKPGSDILKICDEIDRIKLQIRFLIKKIYLDKSLKCYYFLFYLNFFVNTLTTIFITKLSAIFSYIIITFYPEYN